MRVLYIRAVQLDPVDLRGLPYIAADRAEWVPPKFLPLSGEGIGELEGNKSGRLRVPFVDQPVECLRNREELLDAPERVDFNG